MAPYSWLLQRSESPDSKDGICRRRPDVRQYLDCLMEEDGRPSGIRHLFSCGFSHLLGSTLGPSPNHDSTTPRHYDCITGVRKIASTHLIIFPFHCINVLAVGVRILRMNKDWIGRHQNAKRLWDNLASFSCSRKRIREPSKIGRAHV